MGSGESYSAAALRDKLLAADPDLPALKEAGLLDQDVIEFLIAFEQHYEPQNPGDPYYAHETDRYQRIVKKNASQRLSTALANGNAQLLNHFLGIVQDHNSLSKVQFYERFRNWVGRTAAVTYIAANMGYGKTDFAFLMAEVWSAKFDGMVRVEVASNVKSCPETKNIVTQPELAEWMKDNGSEDETVYKLFIFDEASSHASGYGKDRSKVERQLSSMVKLMRKNGGNMIIIGHTGKDVHADVRRLSDYVQKQSKKDAVVFEDVSEGKGRKVKFKMSEIPPTSWNFDTNEESTWEWASGDGSDGPDLTEIACKTYLALKDGRRKTQKEVADMFGITQGTISNNYKEYQ